MINRFFAIGATALVSTVMLTSCSDDSNDNLVIDPVEVSDGVFVINQGNYFSNVPGSLSYVDFNSGTAVQKAFAGANSGMVLGDTPQDAIVYGTKLYLAIHKSNLIRVVDRKTLTLIKDIKPGEGSVAGTAPRYCAAAEGNVYVTMYDGYVARIDTTSLAIDASVKVGPNPDGIAVYNNKLYVANSDGLNYLSNYENGKTVSEIDIASFSELRKINVGLNPGPMAATSFGLYVIARGDYMAVPSTLQQINGDGSVTDVAPATLICATPSDLYYLNSPIDAGGTSLISRVSASSAIGYDIDPVAAPAAIGVEPVSGNIFITAYNIAASGYADYYNPGYMNRYDENGKKLASYEVGISPCAIAFNNSIVFNVK
jgi:hypothetical protein